MAFAARIFRPDEARATSISHSGSVRSEQRSLGEKDLPPSGLRRIWPVASLLVGHSPTAGGCSLLAPRHRPNWAQRTSSDLCLRPLRDRLLLPRNFPQVKIGAQTRLEMAPFVFQ